MAELPIGNIDPCTDVLESQAKMYLDIFMLLSRNWIWHISITSSGSPDLKAVYGPSKSES